MKKALVLSLAMVLGLGVASFAQTLSGEWATTVSIVPTPIALTLTSDLTVTYSVSNWTFTSISNLTDTGWTGQEFDVTGILGAFAVTSSKLVFNPATPAFTSWEVAGSISITGVTFTGTFKLTPGVTTFKIEGKGTAGSVVADVIVNFGDGLGCNFNFKSVDIGLDFPFDCAKVTSHILFDCTGFTKATFGVSGIVIPNLPWFKVGALLTFQTGSKTLALSITPNFGKDTCFDLYITQITTGGTGPTTELKLTDIAINGIGFKHKIGGIEFYGVSWWGTGTGKPTELGPYWEMYQIKTSSDGCCGGTFDFTIQAFFSATSSSLFDVSKFVATVNVNVTKQFKFTTGITLDLAMTPIFTQWTIGFDVTWP